MLSKRKRRRLGCQLLQVDENTDPTTVTGNFSFAFRHWMNKIFMGGVGIDIPRNIVLWMPVENADSWRGINKFMKYIIDDAWKSRELNMDRCEYDGLYRPNAYFIRLLRVPDSILEPMYRRSYDQLWFLLVMSHISTFPVRFITVKLLQEHSGFDIYHKKHGCTDMILSLPNKLYFAMQDAGFPFENYCLESFKTLDEYH